jgi:hypothetical protein
MSTLKTTYIQHPSAEEPSIELSADGTIVLPLSDLGDLSNVDEGSGASDGDVLTYDGVGNVWFPVAPADASKVKQFLSVTKTSSFSVASLTPVVWTDMTVDITPTATDSRILLVVNCPAAEVTAISTFNIYWFRDGSDLGNDLVHRVQETNREFATHFMLIDTPNTTSEVTYDVRLRSSAGTLTVPYGSLYVMEVAA